MTSERRGRRRVGLVHGETVLSELMFGAGWWTAASPAGGDFGVYSSEK